MSKPLLCAVLLCAAAAGSGAAELTAMETRWVQAGWPVVRYAREQQLPLDIVVQPQPAPGHAPLAMGFVDGRCKLVYSMRGNPEAEAVLDGVAPALAPVLIEAMTAHELGHCWRYVQGAWHVVPSGFVDAPPPDNDAELQRRVNDMQAARREEGFADLVGLAWTWRAHPGHYAAVQAWLERVRADDTPAGSHHDTGAWLRRARDAAAFSEAITPFEQVHGLWRQGLASGE
jgi:hypothetical protein